MTSPGVIEFRDVPEPEAGPGEVLLRIRRIGVCGSDVHVNHGKHPFTTYPVVQGHEFSAEVEATGEGVEGLTIGSRATATPQVVCGECGPCLRGDYHICDHLKVQGFQAPGVAQDLFVTRIDKLVPLPDDFTHEQGALVEPTAVAVHATARAGDVPIRDLDFSNQQLFDKGRIRNKWSIARCHPNISNLVVHFQFPVLDLIHRIHFHCQFKGMRYDNHRHMFFSVQVNQ